MNVNLGKYVLIVLVFASCFVFVEAAVGTDRGTIVVYNVNGAPWAPPGGDLNVSGRDFNEGNDGDYNYLIRLRVDMRRTSYYIDLNAHGVTYDSNNEPVVTQIGGITGCTSGSTASNWSNDYNAAAGDFNIIQVNRDNNNFDVNIEIPPNLQSNVSGAIEIWRVNSAGVCDQMDLNFAILITPAIRLHQLANPIDSNVTLMGYGFPSDANVHVRFFDANGSIVDVNVMDVNYADNNYVHTDAQDEKVFDMKGDLLTKNENFLLDSNGWYITPSDGNGTFDVNFVVPYTEMFAGPGGAQDMNIDVNGSGGDVNVQIVITPDLTIPPDMNVQIQICDVDTNAHTCYSGGTYFTIDYAMKNNYIDNMEAAKGFRIDFLDPGTNTIIVRVEMNNDINLARGPQRNYDNDSNAEQGKVHINTDEMPEFAIDANVTMYNVPAQTNTMPQLVRDGIKCPADMCKNRDGTPLSADKAWTWNSDASDGNISFRVTTFSSYETVNITPSLIQPNGGEKIRQFDMTGDWNELYRIEFNFTSTDVNVDSIAVNAFFSDLNGNTDYNIVEDTNILDAGGPIYCTITDENSGTQGDWNFQTDNNCYFDWNMWGISGTFWIDLNFIQSDGNFIIESSDDNFMVNPPDVNIVDGNMTTLDWNFVQNAAMDQNYRIDFNILIPDGNSLDDFNIILWYSTTRGAKENYIVDFNAAIYCSDNDDNTQTDNNCFYDWNVWGITAGRYFLDIDVNDMTTGHGATIGSTSSSEDNNFILNDTTIPTCSITSPQNGSSQTSVHVNLAFTGSDAASGIEKWWVNCGSGYLDNGASNSKTCENQTLGKHTYYVKSQDFSDLNSNECSVTVTIKSPTGGTTSTTTTILPSEGGGAGGGAAGEGEETFETILEETFEEELSEEEITQLLTDAGISEEEIAEALEIADKATIVREVKVEKITAVSGAVSYKSTLTIAVTNNFGKRVKDFEVVETIPKNIAENASEINSEFDFEVLVEDPVLKFTIPEIDADETVEVTYTINKNLKSGMMEGWQKPVVLSFEEDLCAGVTCPTKTCKIGSCNEATGKCEYTNVADGTYCGVNKECKSGVCVEVPQVTTTTTLPKEKPQPPTVEPWIIVLAVVVIIVLGCYFFVIRKKK